MSGRVVVVGSVNVDLVVRAARLPAPGETVTGGTFERHPGGKGGNQAVAAARLGRPTLLVAAVGDDTFGEDARLTLAAANVDVSRLMTIEGEPTGVALILVDAAGENCISVASGANHSLEPATIAEAFGRLGPLDGDVVLVSREIPPKVVRQALRTGRAAGATTVLNPAPAGGIDRAELALVDVLTPNRGELVATASGGTSRTSEAPVATGRPDRRQAEELARRLLGEAGIGRAVVVTLGADGALLVPADGPAVHVAGHRVKAIDATGAGDTFSGALAAALAEGRPIEAAVRRATVAAALSTTVSGAREGMPTLAMLEAALGLVGPG
jgi:ribokinase